MPMTFGDYLECVTAKLRRDLGALSPGEAPLALRIFPSKDRILELFQAAHLFNLGEAEDLDRAGEELKADLVQDFEQAVPAPFPNLAVAFHRPEGWGFEWHLRLNGLLPKLPAGLLPDREFWFTADLSEVLRDVPALSYVALYQVPAPQSGLMAVAPHPTSIEHASRLYRRPPEEAGFTLAEGLAAALRRLALISHPANYHVRVSPILTPREERQLPKRGIPAPKRPYTIVIEHEVLVRLNPRTRPSGGEGEGDAARPPAPHARRGHWMRLAERCKAARAGGRERIWRKETYVGEREFADERNRYQVLLGREEPPAGLR
jgi:hypothetical protein